MKKLELKNDDYLGYVKHLRHACRGIVVHDDKYIIPGGGLEEGETYEQCCERELLEETGMQIQAKEEYIDVSILH